MINWAQDTIFFNPPPPTAGKIYYTVDNIDEMYKEAYEYDTNTCVLTLLQKYTYASYSRQLNKQQFTNLSSRHLLPH